MPKPAKTGRKRKALLRSKASSGNSDVSFCARARIDHNGGIASREPLPPADSAINQLCTITLWRTDPRIPSCSLLICVKHLPIPNLECVSIGLAITSIPQPKLWLIKVTVRNLSIEQCVTNIAHQTYEPKQEERHYIVRLQAKWKGHVLETVLFNRCTLSLIMVYGLPRYCGDSRAFFARNSKQTLQLHKLICAGMVLWAS